MSFFIIKVDETKNFDADFLRSGNCSTVFSYYLVDDTRPIYHCSIIPDYEAHFIDVLPVVSGEIDILWQLELKLESENDVYINRHLFEKQLKRRINIKQEKKEKFYSFVKKAIKAIKENPKILDF